MLYQSSLSSSFDSLGYCFTGMSAAVGESLHEVCIMLQSYVWRCFAIRISAQRRNSALSALTAGAADQVVTLMLRKPEVSCEDLSVACRARVNAAPVVTANNPACQRPH